MTTNYTTLDDPSAGTNGTYALGISGSNIVGYYSDGTQITAFSTTPQPRCGRRSTTRWESMAPTPKVSRAIILSDTMKTGRMRHTVFCTTSQPMTYTTVDDPLGTNGTYATGISGSTIVGVYQGIGSPLGGDGFIAVPTPEPSSVVLLGLGAAGLWWAARCRKKS